MNLLKETLEELKDNNLIPSDILWVGSKDGKFAITWEEFVNIADVEYNNGFGGQEIADDLVVVGKNFWLERHEYDGAENWVYREKPVLAVNFKKFSNVKSQNYWELLGEINQKRSVIE